MVLVLIDSFVCSLLYWPSLRIYYRNWANGGAINDSISSDCFTLGIVTQDDTLHTEHALLEYGSAWYDSVMEPAALES